MRKKRKSIHRREQRRISQFKTPKNRERGPDVSGNLLRALYFAQSPLSIDALLRKTDGISEKKHITRIINRLLEQGLLKKQGRGLFALHPNALIYSGTLTQNRKGFGFIKILSQPQHITPLRADIFIPARYLAGAMHGDTVLVLRDRGDRQKRPSGRCIALLDMASETITGTVIDNPAGCVVRPHDSGFPFLISLPDTVSDQLTPGDAVLVTKERTPVFQPVIPGKLVSKFGRQEDAHTQQQIILHKYKLSETYPEPAQIEADGFAQPRLEGKDRADLRHIAHVTIDGEDARDFDDAIFVQKTPSGFTLYVSIADVSYYVHPGSAIDDEAYKRGTSVYFPQKVIPMLPERLSNDLCSLRPDEDRFSVTSILEIDHDGKVTKSSFTRSIIRSHFRFTYNNVQALLDTTDSSLPGSDHLPMIREAAELAQVLATARKARGSLGFEIPEPQFSINQDGVVTDISSRKRVFSHQIVEEFMLLANESVASFFHSKNIPTAFRVHPPPDREAMQAFAGFLTSLDLSLPKFKNCPDWYAHVIDASRGTDREYLVHTLLLRHMQQAYYSPENTGHFGLASPQYLHFTSPIRRYPDLIVHRQLMQVLGSTKQEVPARSPSLENVTAWLSDKEREAIKAERGLADRLKVLHLLPAVGDRFNCLVSGITDRKLYIDIPEFCTSGSIDLDLFTDDYYIVDHKRYRLFGEISGRILQVGDPIKTVLTRADPITAKLHFKPLLS